MGRPVGLDCLLVAPPAWYPYQPYSALPSLQAYLRQQGFSARILDLNIGYLDAQLERDAFRGDARARGGAHVRAAPAWMGGEQQKARERLFRRVALAGDESPTSWQGALRVLRGPEYYDYRRRARGDQGPVLGAPGRHGLLLPDLLQRQRPAPAARPTAPGAARSSSWPRPRRTCSSTTWSRRCGRRSPSTGRAPWASASAGPRSFVGGLTAAAITKRLAPDVHVIVGGSYFSRLESAVRRFPEVLSLADSIVIHEGEIPLAEILSRLAAGRDLDGVPQRIGRSASGEVVSDLRPVPPDIDSLPTPDYEGMALDKYLAPLPILGLGSSRGCYWRRCAFCDHGFCYQGDYRERSVEKVVGDLAALEARWRSGRYELVDEALEPGRLDEISRGILAAGLDVSWLGLARIDRKFSKERFALARRAGCRLLSFGVESHDDGVLRSMTKGTTRRAEPARAARVPRGRASARTCWSSSASPASRSRRPRPRCRSWRSTRTSSTTPLRRPSASAASRR